MKLYTRIFNGCIEIQKQFPIFTAASFFGFVAMGVYGFDGFLKFKGWKAGQIAQGERVVQQAETATY